MTNASGNSVRKGRIDWSQLERGDVVDALVPAALTLVALVLGWISFPLYLLMLMTEMQVVAALTGLLYPARGWRRVSDALKMLLGCAFPLLFLIPIYVSGLPKDVAFTERFWLGLGLEPRTLAVAIGLLVLRVGTLWVRARRSSEPKFAWGSGAMRDAGVTFVSLFLGVFGSLGALLATAPLMLLLGARAPDVAFGSVFVVIQTGLALVVATMTETELRNIIGDPYSD